MDKKHRGAEAELIACQHLLNAGFEVFRNISAHGLADLIAWSPVTGDVIIYDVKTVNTYKTKTGELKCYPTARTEDQEKAGVNILNYNPDTKTII